MPYLRQHSATSHAVLCPISDNFMVHLTQFRAQSRQCCTTSQALLSPISDSFGPHLRQFYARSQTMSWSISGSFVPYLRHHSATSHAVLCPISDNFMVHLTQFRAQSRQCCTTSQALLSRYQTVLGHTSGSFMPDLRQCHGPSQAVLCLISDTIVQHLMQSCARSQTISWSISRSFAPNLDSVAQHLRHF